MDTQQDEEQNLSKGRGAPCVYADVLLQLGYFCLEVGLW